MDADRNESSRKIKILFLCTGNSCRSQMAEGWARALKADVIEPYSAGTTPRGVDPLAVKVMAGAGVDISAQRSKALDTMRGIPFDYVITMCDDAAEACPFFPGAKKTIHRGFDDPPALARGAATEAEALAIYVRVRDEIKAFVGTLPESLEVD
jgi:arsenate reductase